MTLPDILKTIPEPLIYYALAQLTGAKTDKPLNFADKATQDRIVLIAKRHNFYEQEYYRLKQELGEEIWRPACEEPYGSYMSCYYPLLVFSPTLLYVKYCGISLGVYEPTIKGKGKGKWYIYGNNYQRIEHKITHWRPLPQDAAAMDRILMKSS